MSPQRGPPKLDPLEVLNSELTIVRISLDAIDHSILSVKQRFSLHEVIDAAVRITAEVRDMQVHPKDS